MRPISRALGFAPGQTEAEGWANLDELFSDTARGRERRDALRDAVDLQNYQFNCHGVELGQMYDSGAVVPDGRVRPPPVRDSELYYTATTQPGASLPHAWLQQGHSRVSTLDLVGNGRFTLLTGVGGEEWRIAAAAVARRLGIDLNVHSIGGPNCDAHDVDGRWHKVSELSDTGCVLVRPDRHIAWRERDMPDKPAERLELAMRTVLALPTHP